MLCGNRVCKSRFHNDLPLTLQGQVSLQSRLKIPSVFQSVAILSDSRVWVQLPIPDYACAFGYQIKDSF